MTVPKKSSENKQLAAICKCSDLLYDLELLDPLLEAFFNVWHDDSSEDKLGKLYLFIDLYREKSVPLIKQCQEVLDDFRSC